MENVSANLKKGWYNFNKKVKTLPVNKDKNVAAFFSLVSNTVARKKKRLRFHKFYISFIELTGFNYFWNGNIPLSVNILKSRYIVAWREE